MADDIPFRRGAPGGSGPGTYTILLHGFTAPVGRDGAKATARFDLELSVLHPGPGFPDDIAAVTSYEDIVQALRALCAGHTDADPGRLAEHACAITLGMPAVCRVHVEVAIAAAPDGTPWSGASLTKERSL